MKKFLLVFMYVLPISVFAQFTLTNRNVGVSGPNTYEPNASTSMTNNSMNPLDTMFVWRVIEYTNPSAWILAFCDPFYCNSNTKLDSSNSFVLKSGKSGLLKADIFFNGVSGIGVMKIRIYSVMDSSISDTFTITATSWLTSVKKSAALKNLSVYPNPATEYVMVDVPSKTSTAIEVYNVLGSKVHTHQHESGAQARLDLSDLQKGVYFIRIYDKSGVYTKQFNKIN
ncbi:MAG: T9SS type A sorting domain-containing protein [Bacteroidota bacterium]